MTNLPALLVVDSLTDVVNVVTGAILARAQDGGFLASAEPSRGTKTTDTNSADAFADPKADPA